MYIRKYDSSDAAAVAEIFNRAVGVIAADIYSPEQIAAWVDGGMEADETHVRCSDGRTVWIAADASDIAIAFIDLEDDGHIDMLFCQPEWARRGVASALYTVLEAFARDRSMARLYVEASEVALPFFTRKGFALLHRNDFTKAGVAIHNYAMEKRLSGVTVL
jgi:putative acetyltransferase